MFILTLHNYEAYSTVKNVLFLSVYVTRNVSKDLHFNCTINFLNSYFMLNS